MRLTAKTTYTEFILQMDYETMSKANALMIKHKIRSLSHLFRILVRMEQLRKGLPNES